MKETRMIEIDRKILYLAIMKGFFMRKDDIFELSDFSRGFFRSVPGIRIYAGTILSDNQMKNVVQSLYEIFL